MTHPYSEQDHYNDISDEAVSLSQSFIIPYPLRGQRLDVTLAKLLPDYSRSRLTQWIKQGHVLLDGQVPLPKDRILGGETLQITIIPSDEQLAFTPEPIMIPIIFEDEHLIVVNKPPGLVVHPAAGHWNGTLLNGLLHHCPNLACLPRAGIVHRLDKDTSGLMVVAKTLSVQTDLVRQLQARRVKRIYRAIANGVVPCDGTIDTLIGRDPRNRLKMAVLNFGGKQAITHIRVLARYAHHSYIECRLETGRTHQIRVHLAKTKYPLAGDPLYGNIQHKMDEHEAIAVKAMGRQALHAYILALVHPVTGQECSWTVPLPDDFKALLGALRRHLSDGNNDDSETKAIYAR